MASPPFSIDVIFENPSMILEDFPNSLKQVIRLEHSINQHKEGYKI